MAQTPAAPAGAQGVLPEVVVSGSRQEHAAEGLALSYDVLDADALSDAQARSVREALQDLPNTSVKLLPSRFSVTGVTSATGRDGNAGINIRGLGGNRVLLMVDGVRLPRSYAFRTTVFDRDYVSLELLKRVEVVRGPASALYGSDGMAGLVHFITHEPQDFLRPAQGGDTPRTLGGRVAASWSGDDRGRALAATVAGQAADSVQWMLTATGRRAHAMDNQGDIDTPDSRRTRPNPESAESSAVLGKVVLRPAAGQRHTVTLEHVEKSAAVDLLTSRTPLPLAGTPAQVAGATVDEHAWRSMRRDRLAWEGRLQQLDTPLADELQAVLALQQSASRQVGTSVRPALPLRVRDNRYDERTWQLGLQAGKVVRAGAWTHQLTYGLEHVQSRISNLYGGLNPAPPEVFPLKRFPDTRESASGLFLQGESIVGDWSITPGLRLDHFALQVTSQAGFFPPAAQPGQSLSGSRVSPKLGVLYRATPQWSVFGQYASGFRAPEAGQVNGYFENLAERVVILPNANLKPETSRGVELGVRGRLQRLQLDASVFSNRYAGLILDAALIGGAGTAQDPRVFQAINLERARISGVELKGRYDWGAVAGGRLATSFAYGRARGRNLGTGQPLNSIDPAQLALGLQYQRAAWGLQLDARHRSAKRAADIDSSTAVKPPHTQLAIPGSTVLDASLQWRLRPDLRLNLAVHNLTDRKYWLWPDVQGLAASAATNDAWTQPGRSAHVSLVVDF
ncbi:TonB-dependent hemoglobin/transferrin/lactoferrin family receptor [Pulveribacter suum]|uniref:TonB-dependent hemoglobin/transferrin/lactoferrin family receptor n=1 Tax=Pulveribacter suum TaxID=2116657 RepID=UPI001D052063|nr:TonB-dependent hemoglobin/transferrin/lactoferrin family receptor [Pulveribacter suum]